MSRQNFLLVFLPRKHLSHNDNNELSCWRVGDEFYRRRNGDPGGDLRWRSSLRLAPAPPIYEVMGDHGSPTGISATPSISHLDFLITKFHSTEQTQRDSGNTHGYWVRPFLMCSVDFVPQKRFMWYKSGLLMHFVPSKTFSRAPITPNCHVGE